MSSHSYLALSAAARPLEDVAAAAELAAFATAPSRLPLLWQCLFGPKDLAWVELGDGPSPVLLAPKALALETLERAATRACEAVPFGKTAMGHVELVRGALERDAQSYLVCEFGEVASMGDVVSYVGKLERTLRWLGGEPVEDGCAAALDLACLDPSEPFVAPSVYEDGGTTTHAQDEAFLSLLGCSPMHWSM